jgi:hypothetical protein
MLDAILEGLGGTLERFANWLDKIGPRIKRRWRITRATLFPLRPFIDHL